MLDFVTAGESHGQAVLAIIKSFPAGFNISPKQINRQLTRRCQGYGRGARVRRIEKDKVRIMSGLRGGVTLGSAISILIENKDWPNWSRIMHPTEPFPKDPDKSEKPLISGKTIPRPGHADLAGAIKFGTGDLRNILERASARETATRVAAGAVARQFLEYFDIKIASHVIRIGKAVLKKKKHTFTEIDILADKSPVRCIDKATTQKMMEQIDGAAKNKDTVGGMFEVRATGLPIGLGDYNQWSDRLDGQFAQALMSIPSVKSVEIGEGYNSSRLSGSRFHDTIAFNSSETHSAGKGFIRRTNRAGGLEGGLTNGAEIVLRGVCKPLSTLMQPLDSIDLQNGKKASAMIERSDICVVPSAAVIAEAMVALVLAGAFWKKFGGDNRSEIKAAYDNYIDRRICNSP